MARVLVLGAGIAGLAAAFEDDYFMKAPFDGKVLVVSTQVLGIVWIVLGVLKVMTGYAMIQGRTWVWGRVTNLSGAQREMKVQVGNGYRVTAVAGIHIAKRVLEGDVKTGYQTPAGCYGTSLLQQIVME